MTYLRIGVAWAIVFAVSIFASGCGSIRSDQVVQLQGELKRTSSEIETLKSEIDKAHQERADAKSEAEELSFKLRASEQCDNQFENCQKELADANAGPPDPKVDTCYAQLRFLPVYVDQNRVVGHEDFKDIEVTEPVFRWVMKRVQVAPPSERLKVIPAKYLTFPFSAFNLY